MKKKNLNFRLVLPQTQVNKSNLFIYSGYFFIYLVKKYGRHVSSQKSK